MKNALEEYFARARSAFGDASEDIVVVARRAEEMFDRPVITWEGDAQTFEFSFVSASAEQLLGHSARRWTTEPTFWADTVVHPDDRDEAVAYCALATGKCTDHAFVYRANAADGRVVWLADYVQVVRGTRLVAERLRGIMIQVSDLYERAPASLQRWVTPSREQLQSR